MKKIFTIVAMMLCCAVTTTKAQPFSMAFYAGSGVSNYSVEGLNIEQKSGVYGHLDMNIKLLMLNISPEVIYRFNQFDVTSAPSRYTVQSHSVEGALMAGFSFLKILTLEAGPRYVYDIKNRMVYNNGQTERIGAIHPEWGYSAGVALNIWKISVTARYNGQFQRYNSDLGATRAQSYTIGVGYRL